MLATADKIATFKFVVRTIAQRHGLHASFMPKPIGTVNGSGLHLHQSLWRQEENTFDDPSGPLGLSSTARHYIGGLLRHARAITALATPLVNSYKRLLPKDLCPVLIAWSEENRNTIIRVPAQRGNDTRVILRSPDPACNPYLVLAAALEAGLDGIVSKMSPPPPENQLGAENMLEIIKGRGLPRSLGEALQDLAGDHLLQEALGQHICRRYQESKEREWERFQSVVHQWELDEYLVSY